MTCLTDAEFDVVANAENCELYAVTPVHVFHERCGARSIRDTFRILEAIAT